MDKNKKKIAELFELDPIAIKIELVKIGKNQKWLAEQCGFSRQYLTQLFNKRNIARVDQIAKILGKPKQDFLKAKIDLF